MSKLVSNLKKDEYVIKKSTNKIKWYPRKKSQNSKVIQKIF